MKKRFMAALLSAAMLIGTVPVVSSAEDAALMSSEVVMYNSSLINDFHIQNADSLLLSDDAHADSHWNLTVGKKFTKQRYGVGYEYRDSDWCYPLGYRQTRSSNQEKNDPWESWIGWEMSSEEYALVKKLTKHSSNSDRNLQIGARYSGFIDTQAGSLAGKAYMKLELKKYENGNSTQVRIGTNEMTGDEAKCAYTNKKIDWMYMSPEINWINICVGGTKGNSFGKDRNYARVSHPEIFFKDARNPYVVSAEITNGQKDSQGNICFGSGDTIEVKAILSEPVRCGSNSIADFASGIKAYVNTIELKAVSYNEVDYDDVQIIFQGTVPDDSSKRIEKGYGNLKVSFEQNKVKDLAGNVVDEYYNKTISQPDLIVDGYVPRVQSIRFAKAYILDENGKYIEQPGIDDRIKPGDFIQFRVTYNQELMKKEVSSDYLRFPVEVSGKLGYAKLFSINGNGETFTPEAARQGNKVSSASSFRTVDYIYEIPKDAENGTKLRIPADSYYDSDRQNTYWRISAGTDALGEIQGNLKLTDTARRGEVSDVSSQEANGDEFFSVNIDSEAPTIKLTDKNKNPVNGVYEAADQVSGFSGSRPAEYTVYFKSDEEVKDSVSARLVCKAKNGDSSKDKYGEVLYEGAYTDEMPSGDDMSAAFVIPYDIDSADYDVYIETEAKDFVLNKRIQRFYVAADRKKPSVSISNGGGNGELVTTQSGTRRWEFDFDITDAVSQAGSSLYYRFSNDEEFRKLTEETNYIAVTNEVGADEALAGTIEYYAEDGSGNKTDSSRKNYYVGKLSVCKPIEPETFPMYLESRDVGFTGFNPTEIENGVEVCDYFLYKIIDGVNNDEVRVIKSEDGADVYIPADELSDNCIIAYKKVRTYVNQPPVSFDGEEPEFSILYHCDTAPPEADSRYTYDMAGNTAGVMVIAPKDVTVHPQNIKDAKFVLTNTYDESIRCELDITPQIIDGRLYQHFDLAALLIEKKYPSGSYRLTVTITDENNHVAEYEALGDEGMDIIIDAPTLRNIEIRSAADAPFNTEIGAFARGNDTSSQINVTQESITELIKSGMSFSRDIKQYQVVADVYMKYYGEAYPKQNEQNDVSFTYAVHDEVSLNGGETVWTEYAPAECEYSDAELIDIDGVRYAKYRVAAKLPECTDDSRVNNYSVRMRCGGNMYASDVLDVSTITDTTAPYTSFIVQAVGSDEKGWDSNISSIKYTNDYVRYLFMCFDETLYNEDELIQLPDFEGSHSMHIRRILDENNDAVPEELYGEYVERKDIPGSIYDYLIFKKRGHIYADIIDYWGNVKSIDYECMLIDNIEMINKVYNENTDEYTYVLAGNYSDIVFSAEQPGSGEVTEAGAEKLNELIASNVIVKEALSSMPAVRNGEISSIFRFVQRTKSDVAYDIMAHMKNSSGAERTFKVMTLASENPAAELVSVSGSAARLGKAIHASVGVKFNKPVAQLPDEAVKEFNGEIPQDTTDISVSDLVFAEEFDAVLDAVTGNKVYVIDKLKQVSVFEVDTTGTEFVEYAGYEKSMTASVNGESIEVGNGYIYSPNTSLSITVDGMGICQVKSIGTADTAINTEAEYNDKLVIDVPESFCDTYGQKRVGGYVIKNNADGTQYYDAVVVKCDNKAPVLLDSIAFKRDNMFSPQEVVYLFYDHEGVDRVMTCLNPGEDYTESLNADGISFDRYLARCNPQIQAYDNSGNVTEVSGIPTNVLVSDILEYGTDFIIDEYYYDTSSGGAAELKPVEQGKYYSEVYVMPKAVEGGKSFTTPVTEPIRVNSESSVFFTLTDENGSKMIYRYTPPIDTTPPKVYGVQNNSGDAAMKIVYDITVSDKRSGISEVYVELNDEGTLVKTLEPEAVGDTYTTYKYTANDAREYKVVAKDKAGNRQEFTLRSNSYIVGGLELVVTRDHSSDTGIIKTNSNVKVSIKAKDGRRIYTYIPDGQQMSASDYSLSGNTVVFRNNGTLKAICNDELGNKVEQLLNVANIDKTAPKVTSEVKYNEDKSSADIYFTALGEDKGKTGEVFLLYEEGKMIDSGFNDADIAAFKEEFNHYKENPDEWVMTDRFKELFDLIYKQDISNPNTFVSVSKNGLYSYYAADKAGNISLFNVNVDGLDNTAPLFKGIGWSFDTPDKDKFGAWKKNTGAAPLDDNGNVKSDSPVTISESAAGAMTNKQVELTITADEPIRISGSSFAEFSSTVKKNISINALYDISIEDKAGNISTRLVDVSNILKRDLYIEYEGGDLLFIEGVSEGVLTDQFKEDISKFSVYVYDEKNEKKVLDSSEYTAYVDYNGLDKPENRVFDSSRSYSITYTAIDKAGNKVSAERRIILAGKNDTLVSVNGIYPNASGQICVNMNGESELPLKINLNNYHGSISQVKLMKGQYNGAKMKAAHAVAYSAGDELKKGTCYELKSANDKDIYDLTVKDTGWYTIAVRTLYQDIFVIWVYIGGN